VAGRNFVLVAALAMIGLLAFLTISVAISDGVSALVVISVGILAVLGFGVIGALTEKHDE
jgi:ABC-type transport system involved in multi-copper enzyme maturation permease subunit